MYTLFRTMLLGTWVLALGACVSQPAERPKVAVAGPASLSVELAATDALWLYLPDGEAVVTARDIDYARADIEVRCPTDSSSCAAMAGKLAWTMTRREGAVELGLNRKPGKGSEVTVTLNVPRDRALHVSMRYGDLRIRDHEQDLAVTLKAGAADIVMPHRIVRDVRLRARFGDAGLSLPQSALEGRRPTLVGARVDWTDGPGRHHVDARVRYGDVQVSLNP